MYNQDNAVDNYGRKNRYKTKELCCKKFFILVTVTVAFIFVSMEFVWLIKFDQNIVFTRLI